MQVRPTLLKTSCAVSDQPQVWRVGAQAQRLRVLRVELAHQPRPQRPGRAHLGDLHEEVHPDRPEERQPRRELVDREPRSQAGADVLDAVGQRVGELEVGRRSGLLDVVAGDRDRVEARHPLRGVLEDVADDPPTTDFRQRVVGVRVLRAGIAVAEVTGEVEFPAARPAAPSPRPHPGGRGRAPPPSPPAAAARRSCCPAAGARCPRACRRAGRRPAHPEAATASGRALRCRSRRRGRQGQRLTARGGGCAPCGGATAAAAAPPGKRSRPKAASRRWACYGPPRGRSRKGRRSPRHAPRRPRASQRGGEAPARLRPRPRMGRGGKPAEVPIPLRALSQQREMEGAGGRSGPPSVHLVGTSRARWSAPSP